jgi:hypothetical protein
LQDHTPPVILNAAKDLKKVGREAVERWDCGPVGSAQWYQHHLRSFAAFRMTGGVWSPYRLRVTSTTRVIELISPGLRYNLWLVLVLVLVLALPAEIIGLFEGGLPDGVVV